MWVESKGTWVRTVVFGGAVLPHIWRRTLAVTAVSVVVTFLYKTVPQAHVSLTSTPFVLIGLPLGIFLGFRNSAAYDRFWEGRKLWGQLVNTTRSLTRQVLTMFEPQPDATDTSVDAVREWEVKVVRGVIAFVHALKHHLRGESPFEKLEAVMGEAEARALRDADNVPYAILQRLGEYVVEARRRRWIHAFHVPVIEQSLTLLTDVQGACERIKSTPVPYSYTVLMHRIVAVYCTCLPLGLAETIGFVTPVVVLGVSYALFGLDAIGGEIEQPFGLDVNDLPLDAIAQTIESNLRRRIGEPSPAPVEPKGGVLT